MTTLWAATDRLPGLFHALSDPTRLAILQRLRGGRRCVCDLQDLLGAAQSRLSFHLRVLRETGIVTDHRDGRWVFYSLATDAFGPAIDALAGECALADVSSEGPCCNEGGGIDPVTAGTH